MKELLEGIAEMLESYREIGETFTVDQLLRLQDKLAVDSYYLAEKVGEAKDSFNSKRFIYKTNLIRDKYAYIDKHDYSKAEADDRAALANKDAYQAELTAEAMAHKIELMLRQVNRVLQTLNQRISNLKQERELEYRATTSQA